LTAAEGRKFGLTVGTAFLVLGALALWRGRETPATLLAAIGAVLALAGLLVPTWLGPVESTWMKLAHAISKVTTPIVMGIIYFVVITPTGVLRRRFGGNPLHHQVTDHGLWKRRTSQPTSMQRQF
jgi:Saxitoxin biosynthesis operon protein SxtJ